VGWLDFHLFNDKTPTALERMWEFVFNLQLPFQRKLFCLILSHFSAPPDISLHDLPTCSTIKQIRISEAVMRRPIIGLGAQTNTRLHVEPAKRTSVGLEGAALEMRLRQKRSSAFVEAMTRLDAGGVVASKQQVQELIDRISAEFPELAELQLPLGIVSKCYLGNPYEVHSLDRNLAIIEHYKRGQSLPNGMEKARRLALHPGYAYIEVYTNMMCAVTHTGEVSIIKE
jgi:hypothetical protein